MNIVISQPFYFPWSGLFEQIALSDVFVHFDSAQTPQGRSFITRVQVKTPNGSKWLTVPVKKKGRSKQVIRELEIDDSQKWKVKHRNTIIQNYSKCKYIGDAIDLYDHATMNAVNMCDLNIGCVESISNYLGLKTKFIRSSSLDCTTSSTDLLIDIIRNYTDKNVNYITGHGARNYLDYEAMDEQGINTEFMDYSLEKYEQQHGDFTPYVSILDMIANCGMESINYLKPKTINWKMMQ